MFSKNGNNYNIINDTESVLDTLPVAIYTVQNHPMTGLYLTKTVDKFKLPTKILNFNNTLIKSDLAKLFTTRYKLVTNNLGILLTGVKGTGKSLLLKQTANQALSEGYPIVMVEESFNSNQLSTFLSNIPQDVIILFDEFEKRYNKNSEYDNNQADLLSLFDGTSSTHNMFILTANDSNNINEFFMNRPSRIRYIINYEALNEEFIINYLTEHLQDKTIIKEVTQKLLELDDINFDMLNTLVTEVNVLYPTEGITTIFKILNTSLLLDEYPNYTVNVSIDGSPVGTLIKRLNFNKIAMHEETIYLDEFKLHTISITSDNLKPISGRNKMVLTDTCMDHEGKEHSVELLFNRIRYNKSAF